MFLVDMTFENTNQITEELTSQHRAYLEKEYQTGKLMFGGRKVPRTGGILLSKHSSKDEVMTLLNSDPFVKSGVVKYSITEFVPVMSSNEYSNMLD